MIVTLRTERVRTLDQVRAFVEGSEAVGFAEADRESVYEFVRRALVRLDYERLGKSDKGPVRRYLAKVTGLSRAQLTRLIGRHRETGRRDFHRLPTGAWATQGSAPVDSPWKSLRAPARRRISAGATHQTKALNRLRDRGKSSSAGGCARVQTNGEMNRPGFPGAVQNGSVNGAWRPIASLRVEATRPARWGRWHSTRRWRGSATAPASVDAIVLGSESGAIRRSAPRLSPTVSGAGAMPRRYVGLLHRNPLQITEFGEDRLPPRGCHGS